MLQLVLDFTVVDREPKHFKKVYVRNSQELGGDHTLLPWMVQKQQILNV